ncbi:hypothetical protein F5Y19DRAFT_445591 [Xylariaceae sp. FL1651]|nr:hypothetical protein F5Y19DRAFT_445591 [Xylariaceae sp. FL1651]
MMEIDEDEILRSVAAGNSMDYSVWPALLSRVVARIEKIAHEEFPIPNIPPPSTTTTLPSSILQAPDSELSEHFLAPLPSSPTEPPTSSSSQDTNKENTPLAPRTISALPPTSAPVASTPLPPGTLPPQIALMLSEITSTLTSTFPTYPPHTIQRISELVVSPKRHYRSVTTYLHALDRVVRVTSGLNVYPLPSIHAEIPGGLANGVTEIASRPSPWASPGSDEALGGALLTPIPWLQPNNQAVTVSPAQQAPPAAPAPESPGEFEGEVRTESTETIDGPNGVGSIETVSVSVNGIPSMGARGVGVTQGELLRQEQRAGVVPVSQLVPSHHVHPGHNASAAAQQQQMQARIHHQQALAQAQAQAQARALSSAASPDSSSSATNTMSTSTTSSTTLEAEGGDTAADLVPITVTPIHSNNAEDEERPHARGPEEIGADDLGPQSATTSSLSASTTVSGIEMQGIDIQAAVGRKPLDASSSSKSEEMTKDEDDKMDVEIEDGRGERASTPKRDAADQLEGAASKKLKEDPGPAAGGKAGADAGLKPNETSDRKNDQDDAMDKD